MARQTLHTRTARIEGHRSGIAQLWGLVTTRDGSVIAEVPGHELLDIQVDEEGARLVLLHGPFDGRKVLLLSIPLECWQTLGPGGLTDSLQTA